MNQPKTLYALAAFFIICLSLSSSFAQTLAVKPSEPSFDVILQTIIASNDVTKTEIASSLNGVVKKLKTDFPFSNYRLASTIFQKISNKGEFTSRNSVYLSERSNNLFVTTQVAVRNLESFADERGEGIQIQKFEFNRIMPIVGVNNTINYEQIGFSTKLSLAKNTPTIIGSLTTLKPDELMFLIMTVRPAEK